MIYVEPFTFNPFQENTYVLYDDTKSCLIIDPGCHTAQEQQVLANFIAVKELKPALLLNTHCHIDHVFGNKFVKELYNVPFQMHAADLSTLHAVPSYAPQWGFTVEPSPEPETLLNHGDMVQFGNSSLQVLFTPGHSAGSICFYSNEFGFVIAGDVLFHGSIGRTDLPGGDYDTLIDSIKTQLLPLADAVKVYSGHGPATTIGYERDHNPFLN
jgi:glyoxylase-like metal-dependent hydrolase (beta-lactamase superfamily II)